MKFAQFNAAGELIARYDEAFHGSRLIQIIDPAWVRPTINDVPDMEAMPDIIEVENPACKIPVDAVDISDALFDQTINETDGVWKRNQETGEVAKYSNPAPTTAELKTQKLREINARCESEIAAISAGYPVSEVMSWSKQETEARAYLANNAAATPLLDALAAARGITKADLADRVIAKADLFAQISGTIIGKRQALEDQINALPADATAADIDAIRWEA